MDSDSSNARSMKSHPMSDSNSASKSPSSMGDAISSSGRVNSPTSNAPKAILSCDFCRHRKTKCDKAEGGCSNCKRAGIKCNMPTRQRLPRGRNGGRTKVDAELKARVGRLESLVKSLGGSERLEGEAALEKALAETSMQEQSPRRTSSTTDGPRGAGSRKGSAVGSEFGRFLGGTFWENLSDQVSGLKEILEDESDSELPESEENSQSTSSRDTMSRSNNFSFVLCTSEGMAVSPEILQHPPKIVRAGLGEIYLRCVDPVFKIIHGPTLASFMRDDQPYLDYPPGHPASEALSFAIYLAAVGSQSDEECRANFGESKAMLTGRYKLALEAALSKADLIITTDLTVLTSFIILIIFTRHLGNDRRAWTLLALALRIAQAIGLPKEQVQKPTTPFWRELRRRVWNSIGVLDAQAAGDRGTEPMFCYYDTQSNFTRPPLNINDSDLTFDMQEDPPEHEGITDCTVPLVCRASDDAAVKLDFNAMPAWCTNNPLAYDWETRREFAVSFRKNIHEKYLKHCDPSQQVHQIIFQVIEIVSLNLMLAAIRPLHKHPKANTPRVSGEYVLQLCASALERGETMMNMPAFKPFMWFGRQYNQWHAVAVMAAELCVQTTGPTADRAWDILDRSLEFLVQSVADSEKGMLWRPIEKLLKRARENRSRALQGQRGQAPQALSSAMSGMAPASNLQSTPSTTASRLPKEPPKTANEAMAFTPYAGPAPDGTSLGLLRYELQAAQGNDWATPPDFMKVDMNFETLNSDLVGQNTDAGESPDWGWQNWGSFTEGLQNDVSLFPLPTDDAALSGMTGFSTSPFSWMNLGNGQEPHQ